MSDLDKDMEKLDGFFNKGWACDLDEIHSIVANIADEREKYKQAYELETYERQKFIDELETYKKIAEKLAEQVLKSDIELEKTDDEYCKFEVLKCFSQKEKSCKQCIIDWARKEVEK